MSKNPDDTHQALKSMAGVLELTLCLPVIPSSFCYQAVNLFWAVNYNQLKHLTEMWESRNLILMLEWQEGLVTLEDLIGHLEPSDADLKTLASAASARLQETVKSIGVVILSSKTQEVGFCRAQKGSVGP